MSLYVKHRLQQIPVNARVTKFNNFIRMFTHKQHLAKLQLFILFDDAYSCTQMYPCCFVYIFIVDTTYTQLLFKLSNFLK